MDFCRQQGLQEELLIELGILRKNEDEKLYPMFRKRIMIPIRNKWGRIIAYTARYIGTTPKAPKYINSITSLLYTKGETLFGIDWAFRLRDAANFIIVEGAPDVLRLQSIGLENTVATLGTAWNENQFEILKHYTNSLCFIPDTDLAKGSPYGPGFKAVIEGTVCPSRFTCQRGAMRQPDRWAAALCQRPDGLYPVHRAVGKDSRQDPTVAECRGADTEQFQEKSFLNNDGPKAGKKLTTVFGNNAQVTFGYLLATLFRDIVYRKPRHFPILNLFGEKGTGKTTLATSLEAFFLHDVEPPNMGVASVPAMNDRGSQAVNILVVFNEYKNDLDIRKIAFLKGLWGGGEQTKKNTQTDGMATQTIVTTGMVICGQEKPTQDMALYTRVLFLEYSKTSFSILEKKHYEELQAICNLGLTHLTLEILKYRDLFKKNLQPCTASPRTSWPSG